MCCGKKDKKPSKDSESDEEDIDPDALSSLQVILAVLAICGFSFAFATTMFLNQVAHQSLESDIEPGTRLCVVTNVTEAERVICAGTELQASCLRAHAECEGLPEPVLVYEYYHAFYEHYKGMCLCKVAKLCSVSLCHLDDDMKLSGVQFPGTFLQRCCLQTSTWNTTTANSTFFNETRSDILHSYRMLDMFYDRNKPDAVFYKLDNLGSKDLLLGRKLSHVIIIAPPIVMVIIILATCGMFVTNRLSAKEIHRPTTPITPMHKKIKGKWYVKTTQVHQQPKLNAFERLHNATIKKKLQEESTLPTLTIES